MRHRKKAFALSLSLCFSCSLFFFNAQMKIWWYFRNLCKTSSSGRLYSYSCSDFSNSRISTYHSIFRWATSVGHLCAKHWTYIQRLCHSLVVFYVSKFGYSPIRQPLLSHSPKRKKAQRQQKYKRTEIIRDWFKHRSVSVWINVGEEGTRKANNT